mmetsp:Transcript_32547/g.53828  ORF Transcript_32547/g.53828 Transcript_32547/m.53828 type:complete len:263 (+) Transcript_32547:60-848(+)
MSIPTSRETCRPCRRMAVAISLRTLVDPGHPRTKAGAMPVRRCRDSRPQPFSTIVSTALEILVAATVLGAVTMMCRTTILLLVEDPTWWSDCRAVAVPELSEPRILHEACPMSSSFVTSSSILPLLWTNYRTPKNLGAFRLSANSAFRPTKCSNSQIVTFVPILTRVPCNTMDCRKCTMMVPGEGMIMSNNTSSNNNSTEGCSISACCTVMDRMACLWAETTVGTVAVSNKPAATFLDRCLWAIIIPLILLQEVDRCHAVLA